MVPYRVPIFLCLFVAQIVNIQSSEVTGHYSCEEPDNTTSGDELIIFSLPQDAGNTTFSRIFLDGRDNQECYDTSDPLRLVLQVQSTNAHQACYIAKPQDNVVTVTIIATKHVDSIQTSDMKFKLTCDFNSPTHQEVKTKGIEIIGTLNAGNIEMPEELVSFQVLDSSNKPTSSCYIGQDVRMKLTLIKSPTARQLRAVICTVRDDANHFLHLIRSSCSVQDEFFTSGLPPQTGFGYDIEDTTTTFSTYTQNFKCFHFNTASTLMVFTCTVAFCSGQDGNTRCDHNNCLTKYRVKRQDNTDTQATSVVISVGGSRDTVAVNTTTSKNIDGQTCDGQISESNMKILLGVLAALLFLFLGLLFIMLICCCCCTPNYRDDRSTITTRSSRREYRNAYDDRVYYDNSSVPAVYGAYPR